MTKANVKPSKFTGTGKSEEEINMRVVVSLKRDEQTGKEEFLGVECNNAFAIERIQAFCPEFNEDKKEHRVLQNGKSYLYHIEAYYV